MLKIKFSRKKITLLIFFILLLANSINQLIKFPSIENSPKKNSTISSEASVSAELVKVSKVIDGDTIELEDKQKVRYIGINTPELHDPRKKVECFGKEAMEKNKELVEGKIARLEKDISETDKYKRLLRYVYIPTEASPSDEFINALLVKEGYALASTFPPDVKYAELFKNLEKEARENKRGLWNKCIP